MSIPIYISATGDNVNVVSPKPSGNMTYTANQNQEITFRAVVIDDATSPITIGPDARYVWKIFRSVDNKKTVEYLESHEETLTDKFDRVGVFIVRVFIFEGTETSTATATFAVSGELSHGNAGVLISLIIVCIVVLIAVIIIPLGIWLFKRRERRRENHFQTAQNLAGKYAVRP